MVAQSSAVLKDLRYAIRLMFRSPGFTAVAIIALALGIAANTTIFSVVNGVVLNSISTDEPDRVVVIWETNDTLGIRRAGPSGPNYLDWKEQNTVFEEMALVEVGSATLTGLGEPMQVPGLRATASIFDVMCVGMHLGRPLHPDEGHDDNVVVLSYGFWQRMGGDPNIIGRKFTGDGLLYTVVGVAAPDFRPPVPTELYVPWNSADLRESDRAAHDFGVVARLKPGVSIEQAQQELSAIQRRIGEKDPRLRTFGVTVVPFREVLVEGIRDPLYLLLAAVGFVLLIACANVANLLLAKVAGRQKEVALRTAMGASRSRLVRQFLTESTLLAVSGGVLGLVLSLWGVELLSAYLPGTIQIPNAASEALLANVEIDATVLLFTLTISIFTGLLFGTVPAFLASTRGVGNALKETSRAVTPGAAQRRLRDVLVVAEVAFALVLLVGAGLMMGTLRNLQNVDPGFRTKHVLTMQMEMPTDSKYRERQQRAQFVDEILREIRSTPEVELAAATQVLPLDPRIEEVGFRIEGRPPLPYGVPSLLADYSQITPGYLETMGIPLRAGRTFDNRDGADAQRVAIVSEQLTKRHFPNEDPLGRSLLFGEARHRIVGVAGDVRHEGLTKSPRPTIYVPYGQAADDLVTFVVRTTGDPRSMVDVLKAALWRVDKDQPVFRIRTMEQVVSDARVTMRLTVVLLAVFAALALIMAAIGVYGVMSYSVSQRRQEIGVRIAMGASAGEVFRLIVRKGLLLGTAGVLAGSAVAFVLVQVIESLLYGVSATEPLTFLGVAVLLVAVSVAACYLPARRAMKFDPVHTLRYE